MAYNMACWRIFGRACRGEESYMRRWVNHPATSETSPRNEGQPNKDLSLCTIAATSILDTGKFTLLGLSTPKLTSEHPCPRQQVASSHWCVYTHTLQRDNRELAIFEQKKSICDLLLPQSIRKKNTSLWNTSYMRTLCMIGIPTRLY